MSKLVRLVAVLIVGILSFTAVVNRASASCISNSNSELAEIEGSYVCAYTGDGCSACFHSGSRGAGSWELCYFDYHTSDLACTYYN